MFSNWSHHLRKLLPGVTVSLMWCSGMRSTQKNTEQSKGQNLLNTRWTPSRVSPSSQAGHRQSLWAQLQTEVWHRCWVSSAENKECLILVFLSAVWGLRTLLFVKAVWPCRYCKLRRAASERTYFNNASFLLINWNI